MTASPAWISSRAGIDHLLGIDFGAFTQIVGQGPDLGDHLFPGTAQLDPPGKYRLAMLTEHGKLPSEIRGEAGCWPRLLHLLAENLEIGGVGGV